MSDGRVLPAWAEDLRRRYLRGEASMFVLHGNVYDVVLCSKKMMGLTEFLTDVMLKDSKETIAVYNLATGVRFSKRASSVTELEDLLLATEKARIFTAFERLLIGSTKTAVIMEYAEAIAPAGDPNFQGESDRAAIVTLHRWSSLPEIERGDNVVLLISENLTELAPKLISNPKVAVVEVPMPDVDTRREAARIADSRLTEKDAERYAGITAGLKSIQIASILTPQPAVEEEQADREAFIAGLLGGGADAAGRAHKLAALTSNLNRDEIKELVAPTAPEP
ncbi:MAG TPA: hypothetical protein VJT15_23955, partial [Pyrinomonadaceae bacterium]|nr:hypothetical protein [Pyrinomonadaceae bacterium]